MNFFLQDFMNFVGNNLIADTYNFSNVEFNQLTSNSKSIQDKDIFIAIKGVTFNGESQIENVINSGAIAIIGENIDEDIVENNPKIVFVKTNNARLINSLAQNFQVAKNIDKLNFLGVTGTNGKTTTAYLFYQILNKLSLKSGLISTVEYDDGNILSPSNQTTPAPERLFELFNNMANNQVQYVPMEISSHALAQFRLGKVQYNSVIFTNLTGDHLDFHLNMENYYQVKKGLFTHHIKANGSAIINIDDLYGERLAGELTNKVVTFGKKENANFQIKISNDNILGSSFSLNGVKFHTNLFGEYNIYNLVGVIISLINEGIDINNLANIISEMNLVVPGRLELIKLKNGAKVFVDYAHSDDALKNVLVNLRKLKHNKIITLFGCGGNRDKTKRPRMGLVGATYSDYLIVTSDNPRNEEPLAIMDDIKSGIDNDNNVEFIENRAIAIKRALEISKKDDIVLIAGKGHEKYQEINGKKFHFDDVEEVKKYRDL